MRRFCEHMAAMHIQRVVRGALARKRVPNLRRLRMAPAVSVAPVAPIRPLSGAGVGLFDFYGAFPAEDADSSTVEGEGQGPDAAPVDPADDAVTDLLAKLAAPPPRCVSRGVALLGVCAPYVSAWL